MDAEKLAAELERSGRGEALRRLGSTEEGKRLESLIDGEALRKAFQSGNTASLQRMLGSLLSTPEGKALAEDVCRIMGR